jgi:S-adenosylmethionine synthetase
VFKLNADVPGHLARLSKSLKFTLVYISTGKCPFFFFAKFLSDIFAISTDYVFDGTSPPYPPSARTNPLQLYGQTKQEGEVKILGAEGATAIILRVPVL